MEEISTFHSRQCAHLFVGGEELPCHLDLVTWQRVVPAPNNNNNNNTSTSPGSELFLLPLLEPNPGAGLEFLLESLRWLYLVWYFSRMCDVWSLIECDLEAPDPPCSSVTAGLDGHKVDMVGFLAGLPRLPGPDPPRLPCLLPACEFGPEGGTQRVTTWRCRSPKSFVSAENKESKFCSISSMTRTRLWNFNREILKADNH